MPGKEWLAGKALRNNSFAGKLTPIIRHTLTQLSWFTIQNWASTSQLSCYLSYVIWFVNVLRLLVCLNFFTPLSVIPENLLNSKSNIVVSGLIYVSDCFARRHYDCVFLVWLVTIRLPDTRHNIFITTCLVNNKMKPSKFFSLMYKKTCHLNI